MTGRYCRGCNQLFNAVDDDPRCPQCGQALSVYESAATVDLAATAEFVSEQPPPAAPRDLRREFLGRSFDSYAVEEFLGKGGMAWVFRATHTSLQRPCAIKVLDPDKILRQDEFLDLFLTEARTAASVVHPHIVTVHNIGQTGRHHYIELEYVPGRSLQQIVRQETRLAPLRATDILLQACSALAAAHGAGLVHRDFKPGNILVDGGDYAKLADFGLAKRVAGKDVAALGEGLAGTPYFMAPELFAGQPATPRSDVYAVGVSYYFLLTGEFPFVDRNLTRLMARHATEPPPDPREACPDLPGEIVELLRACLAKQPADRPADGEELYAQLRSVFLQLRDLPSLLTEALRDLEIAWRDRTDAFEIDVPLPDGRAQRVFVQEQKTGPLPERLIRIYSLCCPARPDYYRRALELNAGISHGALAIQDVQGTPHFIMVDTYPRATCDAAEIRCSILDISKWADQVELALTGEDRH